MEDVFDRTGRPPQGWMHAIFNTGPYQGDVGRCIPGPPAPETLEVGQPDGGTFVYYLWTVGSWSDPRDPIAIYNPEPRSPEPQLLSDQEKAILDRMPQDQRERFLRKFHLPLSY
jgi:hypothetical protein